MSNKNKQPALTMAEIQAQVADTVTPETLAAASSLGRTIAERRRSGAAGAHDSRGRGNRSRHDQTKNAINDSRHNG